MKCALLLLSLLLAACAQAPSHPPYAASSSSPGAYRIPGPGEASSHMGLTIQVTGTCADANGFRLVSSGFTHNGWYQLQAWYPDGTIYGFQYGGNHRADENGATPDWTWNCLDASHMHDPEGVYILKLTDVSTGKWVEATFEVKR